MNITENLLCSSRLVAARVFVVFGICKENRLISFLFCSNRSVQCETWKANGFVENEQLVWGWLSSVVLFLRIAHNSIGWCTDTSLKRGIQRGTKNSTWNLARIELEFIPRTLIEIYWNLMVSNYTFATSLNNVQASAFTRTQHNRFWSIARASIHSHSITGLSEAKAMCTVHCVICSTCFLLTLIDLTLWINSGNNEREKEKESISSVFVRRRMIHSKTVNVFGRLCDHIELSQ